MTAPPGSIPNTRAAACIAEHLGTGCVVEWEGRPGECRIGVVSVYAILTAKAAKIAKTLLH